MDKLSWVVHAEKQDVKHQRYMDGPVEIYYVDDHVCEQHNSDVAPAIHEQDV